MEEYTAPDAERLEILEKFLTYMQEKGINVILVLTPYHPLVYDNALEKADHYTGFFATEPAVHRIADKLGIPVYGKMCIRDSIRTLRDIFIRFSRKCNNL